MVHRNLGLELARFRGHRGAGLIHTHLRFFDLTPTGRALNRCLKDMATIDDRASVAAAHVPWSPWS